LLGDVFPREDIAALFPGKLNAADTKRNAELALELVDALTMLPSVTRTATLEDIRTRLPPVDEKGENAVIRFDLCLADKFPIAVPKQLWLDHAIVQETSASYQDDVIVYLESKEAYAKSPVFRIFENSNNRRLRP